MTRPPIAGMSDGVVHGPRDVVKDLLRTRHGPRTTTWHVDPEGCRHRVPQVQDGSAFDLNNLALYLSPAALFGEFRPASPWTGWTLQRETALPVMTSRSQLRAVFDRTVEELIAGHDAVAVRVLHAGAATLDGGPSSGGCSWTERSSHRRCCRCWNNIDAEW